MRKCIKRQFCNNLVIYSDIERNRENRGQFASGYFTQILRGGSSSNYRFGILFIDVHRKKVIESVQFLPLHSSSINSSIVTCLLHFRASSIERHLTINFHQRNFSLECETIKKRVKLLINEMRVFSPTIDRSAVLSTLGLSVFRLLNEI